MTLLYVALSVLTIVSVGSVVAFTAKITLVILVSNAIGAAIFMLVGRRQRRSG
jgi:hypothetical protein